MNENDIIIGVHNTSIIQIKILYKIQNRCYHSLIHKSKYNPNTALFTSSIMAWPLNQTDTTEFHWKEDFVKYAMKI